MAAATVRENELLRLLSRQSEVTLDDACRLLDISSATARRDFQRLAQSGKVERTWGGIRAATPAPPDDNHPTAPPFLLRGSRNITAKRQIAVAAAALIADGDVLMIDGGTTTFHLAPLLARRSVRILTNSLVIAQEVDKLRGSGASGAEVYLAGGYLIPESNLIAGPQAEEFFRRYHARWAFLSVGGLDENNLTNHNERIVATARVMMQQSEQTVVLADHSKFTQRAMCRLAPLDAMDVLITDHHEPRPRLLDTIAAANIRIIEAK